MQNSIASGWRLAIRILLAQGSISLLTGLIFLLQSEFSALAALSSGLVVTLGNGLLGARLLMPMFPGTVSSVLPGLLVGTLLKWMTIIGGLYLVLGYFHLPPLPGLCGVIAVVVTQLIGYCFKP